MIPVAALAALFLAFPGLALAEGLRVEEPWARASLGAVPNSAAYMTLHNDSDAADRLVGAEAAGVAAVELHTHVMEGDVARMRRIEAVELPPGEAVALEPGGLHVMLIGLEAPLQAGGHFPLTLLFEQAGAVEVTLEVRALGRERQGHGHGHGQGQH